MQHIPAVSVLHAATLRDLTDGKPRQLPVQFNAPDLAVTLDIHPLSNGGYQISANGLPPQAGVCQSADSIETLLSTVWHFPVDARRALSVATQATHREIRLASVPTADIEAHFSPNDRALLTGCGGASGWHIYLYDGQNRLRDGRHFADGFPFGKHTLDARLTLFLTGPLTGLPTGSGTRPGAPRPRAHHVWL